MKAEKSGFNPLRKAAIIIKRRQSVLGFIILGTIILLCVIGPVFSPYTLLQTNIGEAMQKPSVIHILGTDGAGRDIATRLMYGGRISLAVGGMVMLMELMLGLGVGLLSGFFGKATDRILMFITDSFMCMPALAVILVIGAALSDMHANPSLRIFILSAVLAMLGWPYTARIVRAQVLSIKERDFMLACEVLGLPLWRRIFHHLLPNIVPCLVVSATLSASGAILAESALSFLGLGVVSPYPSWGNMIFAISDRAVLLSKPWIWVPAGVCIFLTVLSINLIGDSLKDAFDETAERV